MDCRRFRNEDVAYFKRHPTLAVCWFCETRIEQKGLQSTFWSYHPTREAKLMCSDCHQHWIELKYASSIARVKEGLRGEQRDSLEEEEK